MRSAERIKFLLFIKRGDFNNKAKACNISLFTQQNCDKNVDGLFPLKYGPFFIQIFREVNET